MSLLGINTLNPSKVVLRSYSNHKIKPIGQVKLCVQVGKKAQHVQFQVVDDDVSPILGRETCELLGLVQRGSVNAVDKDVDPVQSEQSKSTSSNVNAQSKVGTDVKVKNVSGVSPKASKLFKVNQDLFEGLGELKGREYELVVDQSVPPVQNPPRTIP